MGIRLSLSAPAVEDRRQHDEQYDVRDERPGISPLKRCGTEQADDDEGDEESQHCLSLPVVFDSFAAPI